MPLTPGFIATTTAQLTAARPVRIRKMFGGLGIYLGDAFFGVCDDDRTYFKVDGQTVADYDRRGMGPWVLLGKPNEKYREAPAEVMADPDTLGDWIDASAAAAQRMK